MRILLTNYMETTSPGGINTTVHRLAKTLRALGHETRVVQANPNNRPQNEELDGLRIVRVGGSWSRWSYGLDPAASLSLMRCLRDWRPEVVNIHGLHSMFSAQVMLVAQTAAPRVPIVFTPHLAMAGHNTLAGRYLWTMYLHFVGRQMAKSASAVIADSSFEADSIATQLGMPRDSIRVVGLGVDELHSKQKQKGSVIRLLYAGYLHKYKGVQYVLRALHHLVKEQHLAAHLTIVGEGDYREKLEALARDLDLPSVDWKGFVPEADLRREFHQADVVLALSSSEAFGIVAAEALAMGTPVIVAKSSALLEFLTEPGCFGVDQPPDPRVVARLIADIHAKQPSVGPFSSRIRTWIEVAKDYESIMTDAVQTAHESQISRK